MNNKTKGNSKYVVVIALGVMLCSITLFSASNYPSSKVFYSDLTDTQDTIPKKLLLKDSMAKQKDTTGLKDSTGKLITKIDTIDVKVSKDSLDAPVEYSATDSMVMDVPQKKIWLYNQAKVNYKDIKLDAGIINLDQGNQNVYGYYFLDTAGKKVGLPKFVQGENNMQVDSLAFNFKTQKGVTKNSYTTQQEMFVHAEKMKKYSVNEYYALHGTFTTCDLDTPHFAFRAKKMKLINQKLAVTGPIHPEFEGVPIPIYLPFGFFPLSTGRHSGFIAPQFTANEQFGVGLENGGYYKVFNDYIDLMARGDIYSYGGYRINLTPTYRVKYRYQGSMTLAYNNTRILSDIGTKEFTSNKSFNISWSHTVDSKARPGQSFSASVNAGSTKFNQYLSNNPGRNYQNQLSSSIAYSKNWNNKYNLTVTANHNQNNNTRLINLNLPTIGFTVSTLYPFQKKEMIGTPKWWEKLGIGLNTNVANQASFYDSAFSFRRLLDTTQWGAQHSVPISIALPALGPFQIAPGISYRENWYSRRITKGYNINSNADTIQNKVDKGFYRSEDISFSLGVNTALFGLHEFKKGSHIMAIRHVMRPTVSASYNPGLASKDYYRPKINAKNDSSYDYVSYYEGSIYGALTRQKFGGISFGLDNNLEMKVRSKKDTTDAGIKKVKLIDGFGFNGSYNFMADSFQLSNMSLYLRSTLFEKINITAGANLDPYLRDSATGRSVSHLAWSGYKGAPFSLGNITSGNIAVSTSFKSKPKDKKADSLANSAFANARNSAAPLTLEEQQAQLSYIRSNPGEFADFNIDWSVNISYSLNFNRSLKADFRTYQTIINSNVNLSGDFNLTPQWKVGLSTYYDFNGSGLQNVSAFISRNLHCWQMSINVYSGTSKGFNITISPKAGLLRDLKINRSRYFYNGPY